MWERKIAGLEMPWVSGETIFVLSLDGRLYALRRSDGAVRWITELEGAVPIELSFENRRYLGPVVAGDRVYVVSRAGTVLGFDPDTGAQLDSAAVGTEFSRRRSLPAAGCSFSDSPEV